VDPLSTAPTTVPILAPQRRPEGWTLATTGYKWLHRRRRIGETLSSGSAFGLKAPADWRFVAVVATVAGGRDCTANRACGSKAGYSGYNGNRRDHCHRDEGSKASQNQATRTSLASRTEYLLDCGGMSSIGEADAREV